VLPLAARVSAGTANGAGAPLLFRADSGFDSAKLMCAIDRQAQQLKRAVTFIIKWNPRSTPVETLAQAKVADASTDWTVLREGKRECVWVDAVQVRHAPKGVKVQQLDKAADAAREATPVQTLQARRVYRLTERTIDKQGQQMLLPEYVLERWSTTLPDTPTFGAQQIIDLNADHGTHEQFHSEFKTGMGLVRLPSGKIDINYLVCALAAVAMNLLRLIGQHALHGQDSPLRHQAQRRRIRTVVQELMFKAARMVRHARVLGLGANDGGFAVFQRHWRELDAPSAT